MYRSSSGILKNMKKGLKNMDQFGMNMNLSWHT